MTARTLLARYGAHGDSVRVYEDAKEDRVVVYYRDQAGTPRRKLFPRSRAGRAEAKAWAAGWHAERSPARPEPTRPSLTTHQLWQRYSAAELDGLRGATVLNYRYHWRRWEAFVGRDTPAETVTVEHCASFRAAALAAGASLNQARQTLQVVRGVYRWGVAARLVVDQGVLAFRWKRRKDDPKPLAPAEYTSTEFEQLLRAVDRDDSRQWRAWVVLMLAGHHGQRARAVLHLRWQDIDLDRGVIVWPAAYQKQGIPLEQPLLWETWSALLVARAWRERTATARVRAHHTGRATPARLADADWVVFAERDKAKAMSYQSLHYHLRQAETRAGIAHRPFRAAHGLRRLVVGEVIERTGDRLLGLEYVGDTDPKMLASYDRRLGERVARAAAALGTAMGAGMGAATETVREVSGHETAAPDRGGEVEVSE